MKNCLILLFFISICVLQVIGVKIQISTAELPNDGNKEKDTWHPHLKRNWLNEKEYEMIDHRAKTYPAFLQMASNNFLADDYNGKKMSCGCRFIKLDNHRLYEDNELEVNKKEDEINKIERKFQRKSEEENPMISLLMKNAKEFRLKEKDNNDDIQINNENDRSSLNSYSESEQLLSKNQNYKINANNYQESNDINANNNRNRYNQNELPYSYNQPIYPNINNPFASNNIPNLNQNIPTQYDKRLPQPNLNNNNLINQNLMNYLHYNSMLMKNIENILASSTPYANNTNDNKPNNLNISNRLLDNPNLNRNIYPNMLLPQMNLNTNPYIPPQINNLNNIYPQQPIY